MTAYVDLYNNDVFTESDDYAGNNQCTWATCGVILYMKLNRSVRLVQTVSRGIRTSHSLLTIITHELTEGVGILVTTVRAYSLLAKTADKYPLDGFRITLKNGV